MLKLCFHIDDGTRRDDPLTENPRNVLPRTFVPSAFVSCHQSPDANAKKKSIYYLQTDWHLYHRPTVL